MGVVLGAQHQASPHQPAEEIEESGRPVQLHERRGFFTDRIVTDTPSLFVSGNVVAVQLGLETICLRDQVLFHRLSREKPFEKDELVLIPILPLDPLEIARRHCPLHGFTDRPGARNNHVCSFSPSVGSDRPSASGRTECRSLDHFHAGRRFEIE